MILRYVNHILVIGALSFASARASCQKDTLITIYFASGRAGLTKTDEVQLSGSWKRFQVKRVQITGFTDSTGSTQSNYSLGYRRASTVSAFLRSTLHCDSLILISKGESNPVSRTELRLNRRVELTVQYRNEFPELPAGRPDSTITELDVPDIHFKPDLPVIEPESLEVIQETAAKIKRYACSRFEILGYVNWTPGINFRNDEGTRKQVQILSEARARAIYEMLADQGVPYTKMSYEGKGNQDLKFQSPSTDQQKRQNMRVRIVIHQSTGCAGNEN